MHGQTRRGVLEKWVLTRAFLCVECVIYYSQKATRVFYEKYLLIGLKCGHIWSGSVTFPVSGRCTESYNALITYAKPCPVTGIALRILITSMTLSDAVGSRCA